MERYSEITQKRKREIVLLRGSGCAYKKCAFCDYHLDSCADDSANFALNRSVLERVTGKYGDLEIINSGSVFELDTRTLELIKRICADRAIHTIHFEAHYMYKNRLPQLRREFSDFGLKIKLGLETFDHDFRERVLHKGITERDPFVLCDGFDEANFLFGIAGQTADGMRRDIELGLQCFERICVNIMCKNSTHVAPDHSVIECFMRELYPSYKDCDRVDILINNTDFGVGD